MEYRIVLGETTYKLQELIAYYIDKGWKPQGGVCCYSSSPHSIRFAQAIVKE